jgi:hypothetical protein
MHRSFLYMLLVIFTFAIAGFAEMHNSVRVLSSSERQMTIEIEPEWQVRTIPDGMNSWQQLSFPDARFDAEIGMPQIPVKVIVVGLPQNGDVNVQILQSDFDVKENIRLAPAPKITPEKIGYKTAYEANTETYQRNYFTPENMVTVNEPSTFRSQRIAKIMVRPLQYNHAQQQVHQYKKIVLQLTFSGSTTPRQNNAQLSNDDDLYKSMLINYDQARLWRQPVERNLFKPSRTFFEGENWFKIKIEGDGSGGKEGMYKITGSVLKQALAKKNISLSSVDPTTIQLFNNGGRELQFDVLAKNDTLIENPILVMGEEDGTFNDSDYILFYGRSLEGIEFDATQNRLRYYINHYGYDNFYWLTFNKKKGKRIESVVSQATDGLSPEPHFRDMVWMEEERHNILRSGVVWLGNEMRRDKNAYSINFEMPGAVMAENAVLRTAIASLGSGQHYFSLYVNGNNIGQFNQWGGSSEIGYESFSITERMYLSQGVLLDGDNTVTINYNVTSDLLFSYVDYVSLEYNRIFNAVGDQLAFFSPLRTDIIRYSVDGFSGNDVRVFDVTNIGAVREIVGNFPGSGTIDFADQSTTVEPKRYIAATPSAYNSIEVSAISPENIAGLRRARDVDYIIITHDDFRQQAEELESLRENWNAKERLETEVVSINDVIKEFGWGLNDPAAIRNFLAYAYDNWGAPRYVLLFGDGHFDYKDILKQNAPNLIIPYEAGGTSATTSRVTDDWYTYFEGTSSGMQMAIGRLVVQTVDEAQNAVWKITKYETEPEYGEWLKTITMVADDEFTDDDTGNEAMHTRDAEDIAENYVPDLIDVKKIYMIDYPEIKTASITGRQKPAATLDLIQQINKGSLIINYLGHGNPDLWAHEQLLLNTRDYDKIDNGKRMAMWVAATCEFAWWDQPSSQSFAEDILNAPQRGAIAMVASSRLVYASDNAAFNRSLFYNLFKEYESTGLTKRIGDAVLEAKKTGTGSPVNDEKYNLFGDPALRLCAPSYRAVIDEVNPDSIQALSKMSVKGHIEDRGYVLDGYEGKILVRTLDTRKTYTYSHPQGVTINNLKTTGNTIFRGVASISQGQFDVEFIVPKDISYGGTDGRISLYFWNDNTSGTGYKKGLGIGATGVDLIDNDGPLMNIHFGSDDFVPGDYISSRPTLHMSIADSVSGVNTAGDIGHQILLTIDDDYNNSIDITEYFTYNEGSYTEGTLKYPILDLPIGEHTIQVKAWDNSNNSSIVETNFVVIDDSDLEIRNPLTYPNPMVDECTFRFELSQDADVSIKIYTVAGRLIKTFDAMPARVGYNIFPMQWDGRDDAGDSVANGVYLYKIIAKSNWDEKSLTAEIIEKLIVAR